MNTPVGVRIATELDHYFRRLDRERITHWLMQLSSGRTTDVDDGLGGRIRIGGVAFEGSTREVFWKFIHPILEAKTIEVSRQVEFEIKDYATDEANATIEIVGGALRGMVARTFHRLAEIDQLLRGKGFPDRIQKRDVSGEIRRHHQYIDGHMTALRRKPSAKPAVLLRLKQWLAHNYWQIIATALTIIAILLAWLAL